MDGLSAITKEITFMLVVVIIALAVMSIIMYIIKYNVKKHHEEKAIQGSSNRTSQVDHVIMSRVFYGLKMAEWNEANINNFMLYVETGDKTYLKF